MIEVNLLPKEYLKKSFSFSLGKAGLYGVVGAVGVVLMLMVITVYQVHQISELDDNIARARKRAAMLQKDIQLVDALTDVKAKISSRMAAVETLDQHRSVWVRILEEIAKDVPEFVWLGRFSEGEPIESGTAPDGDSTVIQQAVLGSGMPTVKRAELEGYAFTLNSLAAFMINMMRSDYFDDVELVSTSEVKFEDYKAYDFVLSFNLHFLSNEEVRNLIAQADATRESATSRASHKSLN